jgi:hypothetical protein
MAEAVPAEDREEQHHIPLGDETLDVLPYFVEGHIVALGPCEKGFRDADHVPVPKKKGVALRPGGLFQLLGDDLNEIRPLTEDGEADASRSNAYMSHSTLNPS